ncbi:AAA family ATPase [Rhodococcoides fascians]|uniref:AAA family ATPase n=1 Tax=Rhodococcoides fascians TaxID=1828 RepID=UPI00056B07D6|nr:MULTISPECIES: AAA family ATPase [Rhodococcus]
MTDLDSATEESPVPAWPSFARPVLSLLDDGSIWRTSALKSAVMDSVGLSEAQRAETLNSGQGRADNRIGWALSFLRRAAAVEKVANGRSRITDFGYQMLRDHPVEITEADLHAVPAFQNYQPMRRAAPAATDSDDLATFWFVGAMFGVGGGTPSDRTPEFVANGLWRAQQPHKYAAAIKSMKAGERIAVKAAFTRKNDLPFDIDGQTAAVMAIRATGTITANPGDGDQVVVAWDEPSTVPDEDWYFWTSRNTVWGIKPDSWQAQALIGFAFDEEEQDYASFLSAPYWADKYFGGRRRSELAPNDDTTIEELPGEDDYTVADIIDEGCFVSPQDLTGYLEALRRKKNLILQGPPGTGKTWLAKRLGYALIGTKDRELIHAVQFHPTVSYEDFVRGWRPGNDGRLTLTDGYFLEVIEEARNRPDAEHVLVVEEINRANLAQVMGELLTLLEADKRKASEALKLAYSKPGDDLVYIPDNLYLIGTMNVADRSLAIVDFALRRRFAFADLQPQFNDAWRNWVVAHGIDAAFVDALRIRLTALNQRIADAPDLGEQYRIGHSFFTPSPDGPPIDDPYLWLRDIVDQEIRPLLAEYWFDDPAAVEREAALLDVPR